GVLWPRRRETRDRGTARAGACGAGLGRQYREMTRHAPRFLYNCPLNEQRGRAMVEKAETTWVGWTFRAYLGWVEVCRSSSYSACWGELRDRNPELNSRLAVMREGQRPAEEPPSRRPP